MSTTLSPELKQALIRHLEEMASTGGAIDGTTPGQTWAMNKLTQGSVTLDDLMDHEQAAHFNQLIADTEQEARDAFFNVGPNDAEAMIEAAYDERHPMFLRGPILEVLQEGMNKFFPGLKPSGVDEDGGQLFNLTDLAHELDASEEDLLAHAKDAGFAGQLRTTPPSPLH